MRTVILVGVLACLSGCTYGPKAYCDYMDELMASRVTDMRELEEHLADSVQDVADLRARLEAAGRREEEAQRILLEFESRGLVRGTGRKEAFPPYIKQGAWPVAYRTLNEMANQYANVCNPRL